MGMLTIIRKEIQFIVNTTKYKAKYIEILFHNSLIIYLYV